MACGTPVVATEVGDLKNIIRQGQTGYVLPHNQPQLLAEKIGAILRGKTPEIGNAESIRDSIIHLGWEKIADAILAECNRLIDENRVGVR
jgi:glycosyltransferase involved in cell wall biosynthesis